MLDELVCVEVELLPKKEKTWCPDEVIPGVTEADEADALDVRPGITLEKLRTVEYAAKYLCCWRFSSFRPPQNSFRSSGQGMSQELSSPRVGSGTMASPQVPYTLVSGYHSISKTVSHSHSLPASREKYVEPRQSVPH